MGTGKREHIRRMTADPDVADAWMAARGSPPMDGDVDRMFGALASVAMSALAAHATPIPGVLDAVEALRARGIRVGSCTGYTREMLDVVQAAAADHGYRPDVAVAATEVPEGRPAPFLPWEVARRLGVWPAKAVVVAGDTVPDVLSARNAGMWAIGVAATGNGVGLMADELAALSSAALEARVSPVRAALYEAGAHLVIDSVAELPTAVSWVEAQLSAGRSPS
jgi:phosphonoacetaldehyde hydrolase